MDRIHRERCNKMRVVSCNMNRVMEEKIKKETSGTGSRRTEKDENEAKKKTEDEKQERT